MGIRARIFVVITVIAVLATLALVAGADFVN
jgi:hypothetical protein